ncbi:MAG: glycosyltransferase family 1 protein [Anaerolineales bacterium]|nr:glycosyltransferase family 1 protein [Anaerolineales bacterium]
MKHILITTFGSRGDVQPYVALGLGLMKAGYRVTLVTSPDAARGFSDYALPVRPVSAPFMEMATSPEARKALAGGTSLGLLFKIMPMMRKFMDDQWEVARDGVDAVVFHPKAMAGQHIAEALRVPAFMALAAPGFSPTGAFPTPLLTSRNLGAALNRWTYGFMSAMSTSSFKGTVNTFRREKLGLGPAKTPQLTGELAPKIYFYSPALLPRPAEWGSDTHVTGFWFLDRPKTWAPPADLVSFLERGPAPIYVGFGSMASVNPERLGRIIQSAVHQAGVRAVVARGWDGLRLAADDPSIFVLDAAPHDWLFPRMAAVVHHGGAGTTGAGLRAGRPTLVCPFFGDQPFWGARVLAQGAGIAPIPQKRLSTDNLASALTTLTQDAGIAARAAALGEAIRSEDGVTAAVTLITRALGATQGDR